MASQLLHDLVDDVQNALPAAIPAPAQQKVAAALAALREHAEADAENVLTGVHDFASAEFAKLDDALPQLLTLAETDAAAAIRTAQTHLANVVNHMRTILGIPALGAAADPTPAPEAPTQS